MKPLNSLRNERLRKATEEAKAFPPNAFDLPRVTTSVPQHILDSSQRRVRNMNAELVSLQALGQDEYVIVARSHPSLSLFTLTIRADRRFIFPSRLDDLIIGTRKARHAQDKREADRKKAPK